MLKINISLQAVISESDRFSSASSDGSPQSQLPSSLSTMDASELLTHAHGELYGDAVYPSCVADSDLYTSSGRSSSSVNLDSPLPSQIKQPETSWAIDRFLETAERIDSIRLALHCRQDVKSHGRNMMAHLDTLLAVIHGVQTA